VSGGKALVSASVAPRKLTPSVRGAAGEDAAAGTAAAREKAKLRSEGKGYVVKDGDVINFRFNV